MVRSLRQTEGAGVRRSLEGNRARKGVFITLLRFTDEAREYVNRIEKIVLLEGPQLATLMIEFGFGVAEISSCAVKRVDLDYFEEQD